MSRYLTVKRGGKTHLAHRWIWEQSNGPIPTGLLVHHKNGDRRDNRLENLQLMTNGEHQRHHNDRHPRERPCDVCGTIYQPRATKRAHSRTCSRPCYRKLIAGQKTGTANPQARLTPEKVAEARRRRASGERLIDIAADLGICDSGAHAAITGRTWAHITDPPPVARAVVAALRGEG